ncbi:MAG: AraC family ligand binding domain-containing protein [Eubacteriales bacterium]|nr:AraC family ligand binding domain-containing protein [Eubacteriales bacterium]
MTNDSLSTDYRIANGYRCLRNIPVQTNDLYLVHCGIEQCSPGQSFGPRTRTEYHLHFVLKGKGVFQINGLSYSLAEGSLFLLPPATETFYFADNDNPWQYTWVSFDGLMAAQYMEQCGFSQGNYVLKCDRNPQDFHSLTRKILDHHELTVANELRRIGYLYLIFALLTESHSICADAPRPRHHDYTPNTYVEHALQYICENYRTIHVQDIADYIGINRSYLTSIFKKNLNQSPQDYLMEFRLEKAADLLRNTEYSIQEIASNVGYQDPLNFSKSFKNHFSLSPKKYREHYSSHMLT